MSSPVGSITITSDMCDVLKYECYIFFTYPKAKLPKNIFKTFCRFSTILLSLTVKNHIYFLELIVLLLLKIR